MIRDGLMPAVSVTDSSSDSHKEEIWNKKSAREIMKESRKRFRESQRKQYLQVFIPVAALVSLASDHYSLVKRYISPIWKRPLAVWHLWRAVILVKKAVSAGLENADQVDVVSRILTKAPWWLGGNKSQAADLIEKAFGWHATFGFKPMEMAPHTRGLLALTLGEIQKETEGWDRAISTFSAILDWKREILSEPDLLMASRQWCRILYGVAVNFLDYGLKPNEEKWGIASQGMELLDRALLIAMKFSKDQEEKIMIDSDRYKKIITEYHNRVEK